MIGEGWTDERVEKARTMRGDGFSCGQIAKELGGGITRNAVIGKLTRMKIAPPSGPSPPTRRYLKAPPAPKPKPVKIAGPPMPVLKAPTPILDNEPPGSATIHSLAAHMCKWPIGDPRADNFTFCGAHRRSESGPYCAAHAARAFAAPMAPRKSRRA